MKNLLKTKFDMKDLEKLHYFLSIKVIHTPKGTRLSQSQYVLDMMSKYGMVNYKPISVSLDQNGKVSANTSYV